MGGLFREKPGVEIFRHIQERDLSGLRRVLARSRAAARAHHPNGAAGLHLVCVDGWLDGVKELISAGADVSEAVRKGDLDFVRELLRCQADLSRNHNLGHTPLMSAVEQKNPAVVKMLLEAGPNPIEALNGLDNWPGVYSPGRSWNRPRYLLLKLWQVT